MCKPNSPSFIFSSFDIDAEINIDLYIVLKESFETRVIELKSVLEKRGYSQALVES